MMVSFYSGPLRLHTQLGGSAPGFAAIFLWEGKLLTHSIPDVTAPFVRCQTFLKYFVDAFERHGFEVQQVSHTNRLAESSHGGQVLAHAAAILRAASERLPLSLPRKSLESPPMFRLLMPGAKL
jgi:hypothetical protein